MSSGPISSPPQHATPAGNQGIPRLIYLARILWLCFFPVFTVLVGDLVLIFVAQAREALVAFNDDYAYSQQIAFEIAFVLWMVSAWYVARLLLGKRFQPDLIGECSHPRFAEGLGHQLPRILALVAGLPIPIVLSITAIRSPAHSLWKLDVLLFVSCAIVFTGLVFRRRFATERQQKWTRNWSRHGGENFEHFDRLSGSAWTFIGSLFALSFGLWLLLPKGMESIARPLGGPTLLLLALMSWTVFGGFVLTYLPRSFGFPALTWFPVILLLSFYLSNENHLVAPPSSVHNTSPEDVGEAFKRWLHERPDPAEPVIFVASAGGASRAAYWTTSALGMLEDGARHATLDKGSAPHPPQRFADNIFVISSVSGGSLGAAAFVATLDLTRRLADKIPECNKVQDTANRFTGNDHLSTVLGLLLFPDLVQRIWPRPVTSWDRSRGLEEVWADDWDILLRGCGAEGKISNPWRESLTDFSARSGANGPLPVLALNSTALAAGQQVLQASFTLPRPDVFDILSPKLATESLTLAQAVHNSARFPYVSPAGVVRLKTGPVWDRLGDAGYVEASGALMLTQILQVLADEDLIEDDDRVQDRNPLSCLKSMGECFIRRSQIRILVLDNTPTNGETYLCGERTSGTGEATARVQNIPAAGARIWPPGPDAIAPPLGAFSTRSGRALSAEVDLRAWADGCTSRFAELRLPTPRKGEETPSMNWMLDHPSRSQIDEVLENPGVRNTDPDPNKLLGQNLEIVRSWFSPPPSP